jgi:hypothetical protein
MRKTQEDFKFIAQNLLFMIQNIASRRVSSVACVARSCSPAIKLAGGRTMKTKLIAAALAASLAVAGTVQAREQARMSADQVRTATLSTRGSAPGSARPEIVIWTILILVTIAAIVSTASAGGGHYPYMIASDEALKTEIKRVGTSAQGFGIFEFRYKGHPQRIRGAMAQNVARLRPEAVSRHESGFLMVDYNLIDVTPAIID